jgi:hypothetical protein
MITAFESYGVFRTVLSGTLSTFTTSKECRSPFVLFSTSIYGTATFFMIFLTSSDITITSLPLKINLILWCREDATDSTGCMYLGLS